MNNKREKQKSRWALQLKPQWIYRSSGSQIVFFILSETIVNAGRTKGQEKKEKKNEPNAVDRSLTDCLTAVSLS